MDSRGTSVGDIAPREGIPKAEKQRLEAVGCLYGCLCPELTQEGRQEAMHNFVHEMLHNSPAAQRIAALWNVSSRLSILFNTLISLVGI